MAGAAKGDAINWRSIIDSTPAGTHGPGSWGEGQRRCLTQSGWELCRVRCDSKGSRPVHGEHVDLDGDDRPDYASTREHEANRRAPTLNRQR